MSDTTLKKEYDFGEIEISSFEEIKQQYTSALGGYQIYAFIPPTDGSDGYD